jgi:hypothetical protein
VLNARRRTGEPPRHLDVSRPALDDLTMLVDRAVHVAPHAVDPDVSVINRLGCVKNLGRSSVVDHAAWDWILNSVSASAGVR